MRIALPRAFRGHTSKPIPKLTTTNTTTTNIHLRASPHVSRQIHTAQQQQQRPVLLPFPTKAPPSRLSRVLHRHHHPQPPHPHRKMTTFTVQPGNVPVTLPNGLSKEIFDDFKPFSKWLSQTTRSLALQRTNPTHPFHKDPYTLRSVTVQAYDMFGVKRLGFVKMTADVRNEGGESLPGAVFLRGPSVAMLVMLIPEDDSSASSKKKSEQSKGPAATSKEVERYALLTVQPRVAAGSLEFVELPAGMVDNGTFAGAAANEIKEELHLEIPESQLRCLSDMAAGKNESIEGEGLPSAMYPSAGGCDEYIPIYMHEHRVPRAQLKEWTGKLTGLRDEGEKITLKLVKMEDLWREGGRDAKCLAAVALWEGLRREGKL